ncbi:MAG: hypothetical protein AB7S78_11920 [Candidatus Omnitrophota bacterium]
MKSKKNKEKPLLFNQETPITNQLSDFFQITIMGILITYILLNIFYVYWRALTFPVYCWDEISTIAFKAKVFFHEKSIPELNLLPHQSYPLLTPLVESWTAFNLGYWNDSLIKIIFPLIFSAYLCTHYYFLCLNTNRRWAIWGVALLLSSNFFLFHATIAYRDFILMYYTCSAIILLLFWRQTRCNSFLFLSSLFSGFATFTKLEGTAYMLIFLIIFLIIEVKNQTIKATRRIKNALIFTIPSLSLASLFHLYKIFHNAEKDGLGHIDKTHFEVSFDKASLTPQILSSFSENLFLSGNWNLLWGALLITLLLSLRRPKTFESNILLTSLFLFFGLHTCVAAFSSNFIWIAGELNTTTLSRLILHFFPLAVLAIILINFSLLKDSD